MINCRLYGYSLFVGSISQAPASVKGIHSLSLYGPSLFSFRQIRILVRYRRENYLKLLYGPEVKAAIGISSS